jgi:mersacidin/lichenicidin family type 2 lantibiotic
MKSERIVRGWKDDDFRLNLNREEQALLPDNPAGLAELTDAELSGVDGGTEDWSLVTICQSHITYCPTGDFFPCSWFGCPTWGPYACWPE